MCSYKLPRFNNWPVMDEVRRAKAVCRVLVSRILLWVWLNSVRNTEVLCLPEKKKKRILASITDSESPSVLKCEIWLVKSSYSKQLLLQIVLLLLITIIVIFIFSPSLFLFWTKCKTYQGTYCDKCLGWIMRYRTIFYFIWSQIIK